MWVSETYDMEKMSKASFLAVLVDAASKDILEALKNWLILRCFSDPLEKPLD